MICGGERCREADLLTCKNLLLSSHSQATRVPFQLAETGKGGRQFDVTRDSGCPEWTSNQNGHIEPVTDPPPIPPLHVLRNGVTQDKKIWSHPQISTKVKREFFPGGTFESPGPFMSTAALGLILTPVKSTAFRFTPRLVPGRSQFYRQFALPNSRE